MPTGANRQPDTKRRHRDADGGAHSHLDVLTDAPLDRDAYAHGESTRTPTASKTPTRTPTIATAPCGTFLGKFGSQGSGNGQFFDPEAIAVDRNGNIFVADTGNHRIEKFTGSGDLSAPVGQHG